MIGGKEVYVLVQYVYDTSIRYVLEDEGRGWVRVSKGKPIGCVVALSPDEIGWSKCMKEDTFKKSTALIIATERACGNTMGHMPSCIKPVYEKMVKRAKAYFKETSNATF